MQLHKQCTSKFYMQVCLNVHYVDYIFATICQFLSQITQKATDELSFYFWNRYSPQQQIDYIITVAFHSNVIVWLNNVIYGSTGHGK